MTLSLMNIDDVWDSTCNCGQFKEVVKNAFVCSICGKSDTYEYIMLNYTIITYLEKKTSLSKGVRSFTECRLYNE